MLLGMYQSEFGNVVGMCQRVVGILLECALNIPESGGNVIEMCLECARVSLGIWFGIVEKFQEKVECGNVVWNRGKVLGKSLVWGLWKSF